MPLATLNSDSNGFGPQKHSHLLKLTTDANDLPDGRHRGHSTDPRPQQSTPSSLEHLHRSQSSPAFQEDSVTMSPAAMFLSAFSSPASKAPLQDDEGQIIADYVLGAIIAYGGFSIIRRAVSPSGGVAAVKVVRSLDLSKQDNPTLVRRRLNHEATVWASLCHEHILPLFSSVHTSYADYFFTVFCPAGSLFDILKRDGHPALEQDDAGMMFRQVVRGLRYLHQEVGIVHRDLKLENVLVDEMGVCKIADFAMSRKIGELEPEDEDSSQDEQYECKQTPISGHRHVLSRRQSKGGLHAHLSLIRHQHPGARHRSSLPATAVTPAPTQVFQPGSLPYAAPELLQPRTAAEPLRPHPAQDIWALGVMLYALLTGRLPFSDLFEPRLQMKILRGVYDVPTGIGRGAERVLKNCLEPSASKRWTIDMVDEVAWGIGWGAEGDDVSPEPDPFCAQQAKFNPPSSHSSISPHVPWQQDELRPSFETAQRRSESRAKRSLSRTPSLMDVSSRSRRPSKSISRPSFHHAHTPPPLPFMSSSSPTSSVSSISPSPSQHDLSPLSLAEPFASGSERQRGRRNSIHPLSRSPSPSMVPATPVDISTHSFSDPVRVLDTQSHLEDAEHGSSARGRPSFTPARTTVRLDPHGEMDAFEEPSTKWEREPQGTRRRDLSGGSHDQDSRSRAPAESRVPYGGREDGTLRRRAGSTPSRPDWTERSARQPPDRDSSTGDGFLRSSKEKVVSTPGQTRSRSLCRYFGLRHQ